MASDTYLDRVDIFAGLNESQLEALRQNSRIRAVLPGTIVVSEGDEPHGLFIVQSGTLKAFLMDENGREITLSLLGEGDYFGELALLDDAPRSASVIALERGELLQLSQQAFLELIENDPKVMHTVVRNLVSRIRSLTDSVRALALVDVFGRISRLFSSLAQEQGDHHVIEQRLTQQEIANLVGASREMVNRILRDLVTGGYIEIEHHRVILLKKLPPLVGPTRVRLSGGRHARQQANRTPRCSCARQARPPATISSRAIRALHRDRLPRPRARERCR